MIIVRWCIPDMSTELRDQIRREAYITNEIIIKQETLRARSGRTIKKNSTNSMEPNMNFVKLESLMGANNLSQSQMDLLFYGPGNRIGISSNLENSRNEINADTPDIGPISV
ncbi:ANO1.2 family protein [Megaselia abdita]